MSFSDWVKNHPDEDDHELAHRALIELDDHVLEYVLVREIIHVRRNLARAEEEAQVLAFLRNVSPSMMVPGEAGVLEFPATKFALGNGQNVSWEEATIEQHQMRVAMLRSQVAGLTSTIELHEAAIQKLQETGASCLGDIAWHSSAMLSPA